MNFQDESMLVFGSTTSEASKLLRFKAPKGNSVIIDGVTTGDYTWQPGIKFNACRSHLDDPSAVQPKDILNSFSWNGYDGSNYIGALSLAGIMDNQATPQEGIVPGKMVIITYPDGGCAHTHNYLTFDSKGRLGINTFDAQATCDINGIMRLSPQTSPPENPVEGMIAIADGKSWDPSPCYSGKSYPVYYNGSHWICMI